MFGTQPFNVLLLSTGWQRVSRRVGGRSPRRVRAFHNQIDGSASDITLVMSPTGERVPMQTQEKSSETKPHHTAPPSPSDQVPGSEKSSGVVIARSITLGVSPAEAYAFWRKIDNLPRFLPDFVSVQAVDPTHLRWTVKGPAGLEVQWDSEIVTDEAPKHIAWRSLPDASLTNSVQFHSRLAQVDRAPWCA